METEVFISYSRLDLPFVEPLFDFLQKAGLKVWMDKKSLPHGVRFEDVIEDTIAKSSVFMTCLSEAAQKSTGHFHKEQRQAEAAAMKMPRDRLFILPVLLDDSGLPREYRQYNAARLLEPGNIEMLLATLSSVFERQVVAASEEIDALRAALIAHLGFEQKTNQELMERFRQTESLSFQDSMGLIARIANSHHPLRLEHLSELRAFASLSYAEQAALDIAIDNVQHGRRTLELQTTVKNAELRRIQDMIAVLPEATGSAVLNNKYVRYIARKDTEAYRLAESELAVLLFNVTNRS